MIEFKIGDKAVYPAHGVGEITSIQNRQVQGNDKEYYVIKILDNGMKVMVPTENAETVGLRGIINEDEVDSIYDILKEEKIGIVNQTWNRRHRAYMEKIKSGSIHEVAKVLRDLSRLKYNKTLSFGERKMLDMARSLLVKEISLAKKEEESLIENELKDIFTQPVELPVCS